MHVHVCVYSRIKGDSFDEIALVLQPCFAIFDGFDNNSYQKQIEADWPSPAIFIFFLLEADMKRFNLIVATLSGAKQAYLKAGQV